jgi:hypothetical protein
MWWNKRQDDAPREVTIRAHLERGETLQITFNDEREPRELQIDGAGDVRLTVKSPAGVAAELVRTKAVESDATAPFRPAARGSRR